MNFHPSHLLKHKTKKQVFLKFCLLLLIFVGYFSYISSKFSIETGFLITLIVWSFFVLATPIADAGFLVSFPLRVLFGVRMFVSGIYVWLASVIINIFALIFSPSSYELTFLTSLAKKIIITPYPYWFIIILSTIGSFLSLKFGDELIDIASHKDRDLYHSHGFKLEIIIFLVIFTLIIAGYYHLLDSLGIEVKKLHKIID